MNAGIAGAGLVGRLLALTLIQKGWHVSLFDKDSMDGTSSCGLSAAGMISPYAEVETAEPLIYELGMKSIERWPSLLKQLDTPVYFQSKGSLIISHAQDWQDLERFIKIANKKLSDKNEIQRLEEKDIEKLEPELSKHKKGFYLPNECHIDTKQLFSALQQTLINAGVDWHENKPVNKLDAGQIYTETKKHKYDWVFDCRGLGAKASLQKLRGIRGELIKLHAPEVHLNRPVRLMHPRYRVYIVPRSNSEFIVGATEIESEDMSPISVRSTLELLSAAYSLHPGFAEARIIETVVNCRPAFPDNLPKITTTEGITSINGLYRHGYLLAPALIDDALNSLPCHSSNSFVIPAKAGIQELKKTEAPRDNRNTA